MVQRGPAYTEMALFAQLDEEGELHLINHLGIDLGDTPKKFNQSAVIIINKKTLHKMQAKGMTMHCNHVRQVDEPTAARFNADPARHYEASGCAGIDGVCRGQLRHLPLRKHTAVFYIGN